MTGDGARDLPAIVISLQDGRQLRVDADGMQLGDQVYQLERVEDARQISPYPETIGLRVAGVGLLTVVPARPGDAALALEALYLRRPTLRPPVSAPMPDTAGSLPVAGPWLYGPPPPPGYLPVPPMGAMPPYPPFPPFGPPIMYGPPINYGPLPRASRRACLVNLVRAGERLVRGQGA